MKENLLIGAATLLAAPIAVGFVAEPKYVAGALIALVVVGAVWTLPPERAAVIAVCVSVAIEFAAPIFKIHHYGPIKYVAPGVTLAVCLIAYARTPRKRPPGLPFLGLGLFLIVLAVATFTTASETHTERRALLVSAAVALPIVLLAGQLDAPQRDRVRRFLAWSAAVEAVIAVLEFTAHIGPIWGYNLDPVTGLAEIHKNGLFGSLTSAQGTLGYPLPLAVVLTVGFGCVLAGPVCRNGRRDLALILLIGTGILLAGARGSFLIALALLILWFGSRQHRTFARVAARVALLGVAVGGAYEFGVTKLGVSRNLIQSGSVTHRSHSLNSVGNLFGQSAHHVVFGWGFDSATHLYQSGILIGDGSFFAVDDQWITTLSEGGIVALVILIVWLAYALRRSDRQLRPALVACVATFFIFDMILWPSMFALLALLAGMAQKPARRSERVEPIEWRDLVPV